MASSAENLPFDDKSFDASMAILTVHHWQDMKKGLEEMKRVTSGPVLVMIFDPDSLNDFWNSEYFPELIEIEKRRYPSIQTLTELLGGRSQIIPVPIPLYCKDGFQEAFYGRPEAFLDKEVRQSQSAWGFLSEELEVTYVKSLADDLQSGAWDRKFGKFRKEEFFTCALRLIVSQD